jgi:hypothetical protein
MTAPRKFGVQLIDDRAEAAEQEQWQLEAISPVSLGAWHIRQPRLPLWTT